MLQGLHSSSPLSPTSDPPSMAPKRPLSPTQRHQLRNQPKRRHHYTSNKEVTSLAESRGLRLLTLLLQCAEAVSTDRLMEAFGLLPEITELSSPFGSSPERVAAYFSDALHCRIVSSYLGAYPPLPLKPYHARKLSHAFQSYNALSPLVKFSHFTANQAIYQALEGADRVHVVDLDIMQGLQWPGLFHILASRPGKLKSVRITGLGASAELLEATGRTMSDFAVALGISFEFCAVEGKVGDIKDASVFAPRYENEVCLASLVGLHL